jgi:hypothetical protein
MKYELFIQNSCLSNKVTVEINLGKYYGCSGLRRKQKHMLKARIT